MPSRRISVEIVGDSSSLERAFARSGRSASRFEQQLGRSKFGRELRGGVAGSGLLGGAGRALAFGSFGFLGGFGAATAFRDIIHEATTIQEETEKTGVVFGRNARQVQLWSRTLATSFGIGEGAALKAAGVFGNMFRALHLSEPTAARMSERLVQLAADMASFNNVSPEQTLQALQSGLAGQVRPLRQFGVFLSQDRIKAEALADGIAKNADHLTAAQKVQAAYNIILKDTRLQQGDVRRNTESLSVAESKFKAALENTEAVAGQRLLPALTDLTNQTAAWLSKQENQRRIAADVNEVVKDGVAVTEGLTDATRDLVGILKPAIDLFGGFRSAAKAAILVLSARKLYEFAAAERVVGDAALTNGAKLGVLSGQAGGANTRVAALTANLKQLGAIGAIAIGIDLIAKSRSIAGEKGASVPQKIADEVGKGFSPLGVQHAVVSAIGGKRVADITQRVFLDAITAGTYEGVRAGFNHFFGRHPRVVVPVDFQPGKTGALRGLFGTLTGRDFSALRPPTPGAAGGRPAPGPLGFNARFADQQLRLAQAELTQTQADDRRVLVIEARLIRERIKRLGNARSTLKERTDLTNQLVSIEGQIASIDQNAEQQMIRYKRLELRLAQAQLTQTQADDRKILVAQAALIRSQLAALGNSRKTIDARIQLTQELAGIEGQIASIDQEARDKRLAALDEQRQRAESHLSKIRSQEDALRSRIAAIRDQFASAVDSARQAIGELFQGPVLQPSPDELKRKLGVIFDALDPKKLNQDLDAQIRQFKLFQAQLVRLRRLGAPKELIRELQQQGLAAEPELAALLAGKPKQRNQFFKLFRERERLAVTTARTEMKSQLVTLHADQVRLVGLRRQEVKVEIEIKGINRRQVRVKQTATATGRNAGRG